MKQQAAKTYESTIGLEKVFKKFGKFRQSISSQLEKSFKKYGKCWSAYLRGTHPIPLVPQPRLACLLPCSPLHAHTLPLPALTPCPAHALPRPCVRVGQCPALVVMPMLAPMTHEGRNDGRHGKVEWLNDGCMVDVCITLASER